MTYLMICLLHDIIDLFPFSHYNHIMEALPIDTSHPDVQDFLALIRLQVLTPLSLLINIASVIICAFLASPSIAEVSRLHPTSITPNATAIGIYVAVIYLGQIGYCLLLVLASKPETKVCQSSRYHET